MKPERYIALFAVLVILRGLALQCLYPPLEGPDEYQHIAVMHHIVENHTMPQLKQDTVPQSLYRHILALPHCYYDWQQTASIGCRQYSDFYTSTRPTIAANKGTLTSEPTVSIPLYQAQHPPTYYFLAAPLYHLLLKQTDFITTIYILRIINILLGACALMLLLTPLFSLDLPLKLKLLTALAISFSPLFTVYIGRISNDALALLLGAMGIALVMKLEQSRHPAALLALAGVMIGLGTVTKLIVFAFFPATLGYLAISMRQTFSFKERCRNLLCFTGGYLLSALPYHIWAVGTYGVPFPAQETVKNAANSVGLLELLQLARWEHLRIFFFDRLLTGTLWRSGWSFLMPHKTLASTYSLLFWLALLGAIVLPIRWIIQRSAISTRNRSIWIYCWLLTGSAYGAAYVHALNCIQAHGQILTPSYYVIPVFPLLITCCLGLFRGFGNGFASGLMGVLAGFFLVAEQLSLWFKAIPHWAATDTFSVAFQRLTSVHPGFPSPVYYPLFLIAILIISGWIMGVKEDQLT